MTQTATERSTPASPGTRQFHVTGLDGLRAVAVGFVLVFHLTPILPGGDIGVDVFFVISGYLITALLLRERVTSGGIAVGAFWRRRARRLLPALATVIVVSGTAAMLIGGDVLVGLGRQVLGAVTFSSNWLLIAEGSDYFEATTPELFRNLWSLAVEEQFYLLWPLVLIVLVIRLSPIRRVILLGAGALVSALAMAILVDPAGATRVYYGTDTHCFGLLVGALLAVATQWWSPRPLEWSRATRRALGLVGVAAVVGLAAFALLVPAESPVAFRGGLLGVSALTAIAIASLLVPASPLGRVFATAPFRWVGKRSYGLYLWHWPVLILVSQALPSWNRPSAGGWGVGLLALVITVLLAALSFRFIEEPVRRAGLVGWVRETGASWRRSGRSLAVGMTALVLATAGVAGTAAAIVADPGVREGESYVRAGQEALEESPTDSPTPTPSPTADPATTSAGRPATGKEITAIGDSVMLAATPRLTAVFPGISIHAVVSRQMRTAPGIVQKLLDRGVLRRVVVLELGTNGSISRDTLEQVRRMIGPDRQLVVVTAQAPRGWISDVNATLKSFDRRYRNVELADWHRAIRPHLELLAGDQVHFGPSGAKLFTRQVEDAVARLAELPPLRSGRPQG